MFDFTVIVPVIVALVSGAKMMGLPSKFSPLLSVVFGVVAFSFLGDGEMAPRIFEGLVAGLSASGLYSGVKATLK